MHLGSDERHTFVRRQTVAILVAVVALFVPVWHVTTQVHRAVVPVAAIRALQAAASWPSSVSCLRPSAPSLNKDDIRKVKFSSEYQLTFSLMNADPVSFLADWDIKAAIEDHFQHFVDAVRKLYDFKISSQIKYFTSLPIQPDFTRDGYFLRPHHLPHFINSAEWSFGGSVVSTSPPLNFVLYVPPAAQSPLQITDAAHARLDTNAFLIPQWGGIVIHNPNRTTSSTTRAGVPRQTLTSTHLRNTMQIFISQLRELLGVKDVTLGRAEKLLPGFTFQYDRSPAGITKWSLDRLTRLTILQNTQRASETLVSLLNLIESMPDMVVQDHIAQKIAHALRAIEVARSPAGAHDVRLAAAGVAVKVAEEAFFDPTMVSLLYFPSEHKLAVYMPLFLPVGVPLLQTLVQEFKKIVAKRRAGKVKTE
ncbi:phosphatidylinositol-glycan biosynthesis class S protein [Chytriomyces sp. MP71]|nr:phosphatidylinositol-glycan biosynthesis class S protein [Chytriomyces sp. MP71]